MSQEYNEKEFICDRCGETFPISEMIEEDTLKYCRACYDLMLEHGEI